MTDLSDGLRTRGPRIATVFLAGALAGLVVGIMVGAVFVERRVGASAPDGTLHRTPQPVAVMEPTPTPKPEEVEASLEAARERIASAARIIGTPTPRGPIAPISDPGPLLVIRDVTFERLEFDPKKVEVRGRVSNPAGPAACFVKIAIDTLGSRGFEETYTSPADIPAGTVSSFHVYVTVDAAKDVWNVTAKVLSWKACS